MNKEDRNVRYCQGRCIITNKVRLLFEPYNVKLDCRTPSTRLKSIYSNAKGHKEDSASVEQNSESS